MEVQFFHEETEKFIRSLEKSTISKVLRAIDLLERFEYRLGMPHSRAVISGIFELRVRGIQEVRLFYVFRRHAIFVLHGCIKKSEQIPTKELELVIRRKKLLDSQ